MASRVVNGIWDDATHCTLRYDDALTTASSPLALPSGSLGHVGHVFAFNFLHLSRLVHCVTSCRLFTHCPRLDGERYGV